MTRPNILFLFSDQQRWDTCGCYGQPLPVTPNLDRMAAEGTRFERAFTCQPVCGPARAALQTGRYPTEVGCPTNHRRLPADAATVAGLLRTAGYECGYLGKWHLASCGEQDGPDDYRTRPVPPHLRGGYDDFWLASDVLEFTSHGYDGHMFDGDGNRRGFPPGRYRADAQTDWLLEYLATRDGDRPFFMFCSWIEPHHQNDRNTYEGPEGSRERFGDFVVPGDLEGTDGDWREEYPDYLGCCHALDRGLGRILSKLDELGIADETVVIYTSDHGSHFKTRNAEYKRSCHDGSIRVPLVIRGPGFPTGSVPEGLASLIDLPATVLRAGGVEVPPGFRGRPLHECAAGAEDWPEDVYVEISEDHVGRALRTDRWKYSVRSDDPEHGKWTRAGSSDRYVEDFCYDLDADPHERHNLVDDPATGGVRAELRERLLDRIERIEGQRPAIRARREP